MSSYGSISPSDEGFDRYEPPFYCPPSHQGSPMDGGVYWPGVEPEFDTAEVYHDNTHYISRSYGYEDVNMANEPYDGFHQNIHHNYMGNNTGIECELQLPRYPRPAAPSFVRVVKRRSTANKKERRRTQSINTAFTDLRECIPNVPPDTKLSKHRTANKNERRRMQSINTGFAHLRECIPNVPLDTQLPKTAVRSAGVNAAFSQLRAHIPRVAPDTKLSKIKTLRLATSYISYLLKVLETDGEPAGGFRAELHHAPPRRRADTQSTAEKRGNGRTGWPQHVWALELKTEQNLKT